MIGTQTMVDAALTAQPELFVHISTISVYDLYREKAFDESSPLCSEPSNPYQATKAGAERAVWAAAEQGLPVLVIRPCNVLSARPGSYWGEAWLQRVAQGFSRRHPLGAARPVDRQHQAARGATWQLGVQHDQEPQLGVHTKGLL